MIQKSKCCSLRETANVGDGKIDKDVSESDNNVVGAFHDKDNITEVQTEKTKPDNKTLKEENILLKKEIETFKERVQDLEEEPDQFINYKTEYEKLQEIWKIDFLLKNKTLKKLRKEKMCCEIKSKNKDLENIVCKMGKSSQTLRMITNEQSLYLENKRKMGLGYTDPCPLGQAIACHPKLYDAEVLGLHYVQPDVHDTEKILNDAEESQVKLKEKQFQFNYENINSLYDTFVPQTELSLKKEYFSDPSTSNVSSELSSDGSDVPHKEMPNESKLLKLFIDLDNEIKKLATFNIDLKMDKHITGLYEDQKGIQRIFIMRKVDRTSKKNEILQNKIDQLLEANIDSDVRNLVMKSYVEIKNKEEIDKFSKESKMVIHLGKIIAQKTKDFDDVKRELSNKLAKFEAYFEKLKNMKVVLKRKLGHKVGDSKAKKD
ncbi:hypothetical protein Tco_1547384 [Tanacetum coccineum]